MRQLGAICALALSLCAAACGADGAGAKQGQPPVALADALNPCRAEEGETPQGPIARTYCANEQLAGLEGRLREALLAETGEVSEAGRRSIVQDHQRWLLARRTICGMVDPDAAPNANQIACLASQLNDRIKEVESAVETAGGYVFQRMEIVQSNAVSAEAAAASDLGDQAPAAITRDIRFPRIDNASTPQAERFNQLVAQQPQFGIADQTDESVTYEIAYAGPELISVRFDIFNATLGAMHPDRSAKAVNVVMTTGQPLTAADVFRAGSGWERALAQEGVEGLAPQFRANGGAPNLSEVRDHVVKPQFWLITEAGLVLLFPPYSVSGPLDPEGQSVTVSWRDLARYLNPRAPRPIRAPVRARE